MRRAFAAYVILIALAALTALAVPRVRSQPVYAPELFGGFTGYGIRAAGMEAYYIPVRWDDGRRFGFVMFGALDDNRYNGFVMQVAGERIASYPPFDCSSGNMYCYERENKPRWRGWIEFRGHRRKFCESAADCGLLEGN